METTAKPKAQQDNSKAKKLLDVTKKLREMAEKLFFKKNNENNRTNPQPKVAGNYPATKFQKPKNKTKQEVEPPDMPDVYVSWATSDGEINCENWGNISMKEAIVRLAKVKDVVAKTFTDIYPNLETMTEEEIKVQLKAIMYRKYLTEK